MSGQNIDDMSAWEEQVRPRHGGLLGSLEDPCTGDCEALCDCGSEEGSP